METYNMMSHMTIPPHIYEEYYNHLMLGNPTKRSYEEQIERPMKRPNNTEYPNYNYQPIQHYYAPTTNTPVPPAPRKLKLDPESLHGVASAYRYKLTIQNPELTGTAFNFVDKSAVFSFHDVEKKRALKKEEWPLKSSPSNPLRYDVNVQLMAENVEIKSCSGCSMWKEKTKKPFLILTPEGDQCVQFTKSPFLLLIFRCCPKFHSFSKQFKLLVTVTSPLTGMVYKTEVHIHRKKFSKKRKHECAETEVIEESEIRIPEEDTSSPSPVTQPAVVTEEYYVPEPEQPLEVPSDPVLEPLPKLFVQPNQTNFPFPSRAPLDTYPFENQPVPSAPSRPQKNAVVDPNLVFELLYQNNDKIGNDANPKVSQRRTNLQKNYERQSELYENGYIPSLFWNNIDSYPTEGWVDTVFTGQPQEVQYPARVPPQYIRQPMTPHSLPRTNMDSMMWDWSL